MQQSPLHRLARQHLDHPEVRFHPGLDRTRVRGVTLTVESGCDLFEGERVLALFEEPGAAAGPDAPFVGWALSSRQLFAGGRAVRLDALAGARLAGPDVVEIGTPWGALGARSAAAAQLAAFVAALATVPPHARAEPPRPLVAPGPSDPLGVLPEMNALERGMDDRALQLVGLLSQAIGPPAQMPRDVALDLARRAVLVHRARNDGRGMADGWWTSALPAPDLAALLHRLCGRPAHAFAEDAAGTTRLVFEAPGAALAQATAAFGDAAAAALGALPGARIEARVANLRGHGAMQLQAAVATGDARAAHLVRAHLFEALLEAEARLLALRALWGWSTPVEALLAMPPQQHADRLRVIAPLADAPALLPGLPKSPALEAVMAEALRTADVEMAMTPAERRAEAWRRWEESLRAPEEVMFDAALGLMHAQAYDEAMAAYQALIGRFPARRADAIYSMGDAALLGALHAPGGPAPEHVPRLEQALALYEDAMRLGCPSERCAENLWEACAALAKVHPDRNRRIAVVERYRVLYPQGAHIADADALVKTL